MALPSVSREGAPQEGLTYPTEQEMARAYFAQLDPATVSADEYAEAMMEAREPSPTRGFGFPEVEPEEAK